MLSVILSIFVYYKSFLSYIKVILGKSIFIVRKVRHYIERMVSAPTKDSASVHPT